MPKKKIIFDSILNIIAAAVPTLLIQIIILPIIGKRLGDENYGLAITLISMATLFSLPFGSVLNNIRLLMNDEYNNYGLQGDFKILLTVGMIINSVFIIIGTIYYEEKISIISLLLILLFSCQNILREYLVVSFRISLNYKAILLNNLILGMGYLFGLAIFFWIGYWQFIYVFGASFSLIYIIKKSDLIRERFSRTEMFNKTANKSVVLFFSVFMKTVLTYADKLLLFPLLGPAAVSIYYSSTLMGKIASMVVTPISGVMLSYLTKMEKMKLRDFFSILFLGTIVGIMGYFLIIFISEPILNILYPAWATESLKLIYLTTATAIIGVITSIINPIILRFNHINWQLIINIINLIVYIIFVFIFYSEYGLMGFCLGMLLASIVKLFIMVLVFVVNYRNKSSISLSCKNVGNEE
ncbi:lipopolysaccharide biosynthesis protein [Cytobacillus kochii]|uniref:lipopolysaccharide biosynthesis protein n=1 Tax=Cytobacillus kochii TaxID=859143 RepID=UPI0025A0FA4F|nr:hypothetical protein [Cytobacillus kochii]MDM5209487.1 hypothetical protein [Cytobacillus kochii]